MEDIHKKMEKAKKDVLEYDKVDVENEEHELVDVADLIVENKLYIDRIDALLGN